MERTIFYAPDILITNQLPEEESAHCSRVLRKRAGDEILITDGKGTFVEACITLPHPKHTGVKVQRKYACPKHWQPNIHIAFAPTKKHRPHRVVSRKSDGNRHRPSNTHPLRAFRTQGGEACPPRKDFNIGHEAVAKSTTPPLERNDSFQTFGGAGHGLAEADSTLPQWRKNSSNKHPLVARRDYPHRSRRGFQRSRSRTCPPQRF